jgi:protein-ribulosamine 3-kinase
MKQLENILGEKITSNNSVGGGCIADARIIETESKQKFFVKTYQGHSNNILQKEANGLIELKRANAVRVPEVIHIDDEYLVLENINSGRKVRSFSEIFGKQFADLHRYSSDSFGFYEDNYIGSSPQKNNPQKDNWSEFYWQNRLMFQLKLAEQNGYIDSSLYSTLKAFEKNLYSILEGTEEKPSLLHGDLWGGNYMVDETGNPVLIDPAVYYGHREADLGMTMLFGGFDSRFYLAYNEAYPLPYGWKERMDLYKLYHVINHLNLFGSGYYSQMMSIINRYL